MATGSGKLWLSRYSHPSRGRLMRRVARLLKKGPLAPQPCAGLVDLITQANHDFSSKTGRDPDVLDAWKTGNGRSGPGGLDPRWLRVESDRHRRRTETKQ